MANGDDFSVESSMQEEAYRYFLIGLRRAIRESSYKSEKDFAEGIMSPVNFSKSLTGKHRMRDANMVACAKKLDMDVSEIVLLGKQVEADQADKPPLQQTPYTIPGVQAGHINPTDVMSAVSTLVGQYQKNDERMRFWRSIFEALPVAAMIIKNGVVCFQNVKSRELGTHVGGPICDTCNSTGCSDKCIGCQKRGNCEDCTCPISMAMNLAKATSGHLLINGLKHLVEVSPLALPDVEYYVVVVAAVIEESSERRNGGDRRQG